MARYAREMGSRDLKGGVFRPGAPQGREENGTKNSGEDAAGVFSTPCTGSRCAWGYSASMALAASLSLSVMPNALSASLLTYRLGSVMIS